ncbi:MAG: hypothetical protein IKB88_09725 [Clostridia bacterium]|nr:hypothetical protein [Clostridia bacterium]
MDEKTNDKIVEISENNNVVSKTNKNYTANALRYAIALLTIVSFFTTSNGLKNLLVGNHSITSYFISFGIQVVVLVVGSNLWNIIENTYKKHNNGKETVKKIAAVLIIVAYLFSVFFSSFFSYVFISTNVYSNVASINYNIELESFITRELKNLKEINQLEGRIILEQIQSNMPELQKIVDDLQTKASEELDDTFNESTISKVSFYGTETGFDAEALIASYENLNEAQQVRARAIEQALNGIAAVYESEYDSYEKIYNTISVGIKESDISSLHSTITSSRNNLISMRDNLDNLSDTNSTFNNTLQISKNTLRSKLNSLINIYDSYLVLLQNASEDKNIVLGQIDVDDLYKTIYSADKIDDNELKTAIESLQKLLQAYQETTESAEIKNEIMSNLSNCIVYLGEYQKYVALDDAIAKYENTVLNQVYVIEVTTKAITTEPSTEDTTDISETTESTTNITTQPPTTILSETKSETETIETTTPLTTGEEGEIDVNIVYENEWNEAKRVDMGKFIKLLKSLPDVNVLLKLVEGQSTYVNALKDYKEYQTDTIYEAYKYSRNKLEGISEVESAILYFFSDFPLMAWFSLIMSLFIDFTPFGVGMYLSLNETSEKKSRCSLIQDKNQEADENVN